MVQMSRNQQNYIIMTVIYDELNDFYHSNGETFRDARDLVSELINAPYEAADDYIKQSITSVLNNYGAIVSSFKPFLKDWKWERLPLLTQAILLMAYAHFYYVEKVDKKIVINVAVELAKKYIDEKQARFINAILDGVIK